MTWTWPPVSNKNTPLGFRQEDPEEAQATAVTPNLTGWNMTYWNLLYLVGGDWNHGMDYDFPNIGNNHPNWLSLHHFSEG